MNTFLEDLDSVRLVCNVVIVQKACVICNILVLDRFGMICMPDLRLICVHSVRMLRLAEADILSGWNYVLYG